MSSSPVQKHAIPPADTHHEPQEYLEPSTSRFDPTYQVLPIANIARIMKSTLPDNAKIAKDAKECIQESVSEFISFVTSEASEKCHNEKRKTINGDDIVFSLNTLGFEKYGDALKPYLEKFREANKNERTASGSRSDQ
ncbi:Nuclear transcription factor Y subunit beta [Neolecta irregularis DAH-3]|uniref:Nuclear transcription factor Y subunit beta n=1 Tax=Neolecta irregularis (strain DAH-3) TaxID=1198029 RepID=A0A1U7LG91_NEOID|nr:Nuclear transcription factor Y subunit beta [Neolecta irregularis DAH-3]|eukprot:OLL21676.1 Nuclear transcription factor Y subunit beta [Neolecta irregularis DAH-3]